MGYTIPKREILQVKHCDITHKLRYVTTLDPNSGFYFLYEVKDEKFIKLGKGKNPLELEEKHIKM